MGQQAHSRPRVGLIMGSQSDWPTMRHAAAILEELAIDHEVRLVSHGVLRCVSRLPDLPLRR